MVVYLWLMKLSNAMTGSRLDSFEDHLFDALSDSLL